MMMELDMAIQTQFLDPNAQSYTDDQIIGKINTGTANITRAGSVDAAARPIASGEVGATEIAANAVTVSELAATAAKDNLDAMGDTARGYIQTKPVTGQFPVTAIQRHTDGTFEQSYDDVAI